VDDDKSEDDYLLYLSSPQSEATYETLDRASDIEKSSRLISPVCDRSIHDTLQSRSKVAPEKTSECIFHLTKQQVNRTQRVASKVNDKLEIISSLASSVSKTYTFSPSSLQRSEDIDKLEEEIRSTTNRVRDLRRRSVAMLLTDLDGSRAAENLITPFYLNIEKEISSLQDHLLLLEKQKESMINELQIKVLKSNDSPLNMERPMTLVQEVCLVDNKIPENLCSENSD